jgi:hypothetical protein
MTAKVNGLEIMVTNYDVWCDECEWAGQMTTSKAEAEEQARDHDYFAHTLVTVIG